MRGHLFLSFRPNEFQKQIRTKSKKTLKMFLAMGLGAVVGLGALGKWKGITMSEKILFQPPPPSDLRLHRLGRFSYWCSPITKESHINDIFIHFHANACNVSESRRFLSNLIHPSSTSLLLAPEYIGYSPWDYEYVSPSVEQTKLAIETICFHVLSQLKQAKRPRIHLIGVSLGTGFACWMANRLCMGPFLTLCVVSHVVLISPFTSIRRLGKQLTGSGCLASFVIPTRYLNNENELKRLPHQVRVMLIHGDRDDIVSISHSYRLMKIFHPHLRLVVKKNEGHNRLSCDKDIQRFLSS